MLLKCSLPNRNDKDYQTIITAVVVSEVASAVAVDLHTHLLPPKHGALCLWGIDELLTYHYLVAEYFVTAPPSDFISPCQPVSHEAPAHNNQLPVS